MGFLFFALPERVNSIGYIKYTIHLQFAWNYSPVIDEILTKTAIKKFDHGKIFNCRIYFVKTVKK